MINVPYHLALRLGRLRRALYVARLPALLRRPPPAGPEVPARLVSFSSSGDVPEQVASWRSFLAHVGTPAELVVMSDGSHTEADRRLLGQVHPRVRIRPAADWLGPEVAECVRRYAARHPFGKKLALFLSLGRDGTDLYADSDILFFPAAGSLRARVAGGVAPADYLPDCAVSLDARLIRDAGEKTAPVNGGFALVRRPPDWAEPLARLAALAGEPGFFSEQTVVHLAMHRSGAAPLPADTHVLKADDQWRFRDFYAGQPGLVLRHYISSIRYKMWRQVRWHPRPAAA